MFDSPQIQLRIQAERIIRSDRLARNEDVSHLCFEAMTERAARDYLAAVQHIARVAGILFDR